MARTLSRFYFLKKDENKDKATLFVRVQDPSRKIDLQFTTRVKTSVPEWKAAVANEDSLARHRKNNPKLHDTLGRIEVMLDREMSAPEFDRERIKAEILLISDPEKSEILRKQREAAEAAKHEEERIKEEQARLIKEGIDAERAKIWNFLDRFCEEIKRGTRLNGHSRYAPGTVKAWFKMTSRDVAFRDAWHGNLAGYLRAVTPDEFDKFIGDASIDFDNILEANREVLKRLKQADDDE